MLSIYVLDTTAASRNEIVNQINTFLRSDFKDHLLIPRFSLKPVTRQELKFNSAPDICIIGSEFISSEMSELVSIKKLLPDSALLVRTSKALEGLATIEQLARMGADDVISEKCDAQEFFRKLILLSRKRKQTHPGKLVIVDSSKGGLGVTSLVAGLGETLLSQGKRVALLDLDFATQNLSRFLQVKPFVNENLQLIFEQNRPITEESVQQSLFKVWDDEDGLLCMPPPAETDDFYDARSSYPKILVALLETLDHMFDCVVVDVGSARSTLLRTLYRVADKVVCVINNDPASLYSSVERISKIKNSISPNAEIIVVENAVSKHGLPSDVMKDEISRGAGLRDENWFNKNIPLCTNSGRWPGSGNTIYSCGNRTVSKILESLAAKLELISATEQRPHAENSYKDLINTIATKFIGVVKTDKSLVKPLSLPASTLQSADETKPLLKLPEPAASRLNVEAGITKPIMPAGQDLLAVPPKFVDELSEDNLVSSARII